MTYPRFEEITRWQRETFTEATAISKLNHLEQEVQELKQAIQNGCPDVNEELADCLILLYGVADCMGLKFWEICKAIDKKMAKNKQRTWGLPDANGVVNHIKQEGE